jgi:hypothetical protein
MVYVLRQARHNGFSMKSVNSRERGLSDGLTNYIVMAVADHYGTKDILALISRLRMRAMTGLHP